MIEIIITFTLFIIGGYLIGNISFARMLSKKMHNDITKLGSGNPGTMNMARNFGFGIGLLNLVLDIAKSVIPCLCALFVAKAYFPHLTNILVYSTGFAIMIGNMFPVFYKFKGGKGVAVVLGMFAVLYPLW
ncbi:MAG: glycerol-3-phosphate acyltransferase, partial [Christensenellales bacterium]